MDFLKYYSRKDVQNKIFNASKYREIGVKFGDRGFGKRPDMLQYESDVLEFAKQGATSFHISEERWDNPMELRTEMSKREMDELRKGWDYILDVDCDFLEYSKITANLLIDALKFHDVKNVGIKFSGRRSFHIMTPFESFPEEVNGIKTKTLFPEAPRIMAEYLKEMIRKPLSEAILSISKLDDVSKSTGKKVTELVSGDDFDPYSVIGIDTVLIANRHLFRSPYSINEKSGLVSLPISINEIKSFRLDKAKPENAETNKDFFDFKETGDATYFITQSFDWKKKVEKKDIQVREYGIPKVAIKDENFFPPCIKLLMNGVKQDGRKRAVFILINYFKQLGWSAEDIEKELDNWNKKNYQPLKEGYVKSQINWHRRREGIMPPNCNNKDYYTDIGVCQPDNWCKLIKNPVQYVSKKISVIKRYKQKDIKGVLIFQILLALACLTQWIFH